MARNTCAQNASAAKVMTVPGSETGSALGVNQVIRQIGFSIGSALGAAILTGHTIAPDPLPTDAGYSVSALVGLALCLVTAVLSFVLPRRATKDSELSLVDEAQERLLIEESVDGSAGGIMLLDTDVIDTEAEGAVGSLTVDGTRQLVAARR